MKAARVRSPDLITSAVRLNVGSGLAAVREICSEQVIPVVFVTSTPWEVRERDSGAVIVPKPFGQAALQEASHVLLQRQHGERSRGQTAA